MITVKPFNINVLSTHKGFFLLDKLPKNKESVDVWIQTPTGNESVDFVDVFKMADGSLLAAWQHPFQKLPLHNLQVFCDGVVQVLNLYTFERILDIYNKPSDSEYGTFTFCPSKIVPNGDWRCDQSMYGPMAFETENLGRVIEGNNEVVFYEPFLSVNGIGHIIYLETRNKSELAKEKLNNSVVPVTGRTIQECLRLVYEWSVLAKEPFNSKDEAAIVALKFVESMGFTQTEISELEKLTPMQISKFIGGSLTARLRDMDIPELSDAIAEIVFSRIASSALSFIVSRNPSIWNLDEIIAEEWNQYNLGILRFKNYYNLPDSVNIGEETKIMEHVLINFSNEKDYVYIQLRGFRNKYNILKSLEN